MHGRRLRHGQGIQGIALWRGPVLPYAPFESKAADGSLVGFDIDLGNAICAELKVKCKWVESDFDGMIPGLNANKFDGVISSMTVTEARQKAIDFSSELFSGPTSLVFKKGANYSTPESLKGKSVGYEQGTIQEAYAKAVLDKAGVITKAYAPTRTRSMPT